MDGKCLYDRILKRLKAADGLIQYKTVGIPEQKLRYCKPGVIADIFEAAQLTGLREVFVAVGTNDAAAAQAGAGNTRQVTCECFRQQ